MRIPKRRVADLSALRFLPSRRQIDSDRAVGAMRGNVSRPTGERGRPLKGGEMSPWAALRLQRLEG